MWHKLQTGWQQKKELSSFAKLKSTTMIDGQRDSEAGVVDKGERTYSITQEERAGKKGKGGEDNKAWIVQEKREQQRETDVTFTNGRE